MSWLISARRRWTLTGRRLRSGLVVVLAATTIAACGGHVDGSDRASAAATTRPGRSAATPAPVDTSVLTGDVPPSGDSPPPVGRTSTAATSGVPGACTLITQADLTAATRGVVTLSFPSPANEQAGSSVLTGASSTCRRPLESIWTDASGRSQLGGSVIVTIQSGGADLYFPIQVGDPVTGLGDEAMSRGPRLYIRLGAGLLVISVGISSPTPDPAATELGWAKQLAPIALRRLGR